MPSIFSSTASRASCAITGPARADTSKSATALPSIFLIPFLFIERTSFSEFSSPSHFIQFVRGCQLECRRQVYLSYRKAWLTIQSDSNRRREEKRRRP